MSDSTVLLPRPVALVTGVGRRRGIGAAIALALAEEGWDVATTWWSGYDDRMPWGRDPATADDVGAAVRHAGGRHLAIEADLAETATAEAVFDRVEATLGPVTGLVVAHCESVDSATLTATVETFDRHYAVNVRATWLLIAELGRRFPAAGRTGLRGRIVTLTSDHVVGNLPYGATKAAADRVTLAAAYDLAHLGITANVVNPGPTDTGWMDDEVRAHAAAKTPLPRAARAEDAANLIRFLCSEEGGWITGQLLLSNGGFKGSIP